MKYKESSWLNTKPNSAKTLIERAKREVPDFIEHYAKFEKQKTSIVPNQCPKCKGLHFDITENLLGLRGPPNQLKVNGEF